MDSVSRALLLVLAQLTDPKPVLLHLPGLGHTEASKSSLRSQGLFPKHGSSHQKFVRVYHCSIYPGFFYNY